MVEADRQLLRLWQAITAMAPPGENAMRWAVHRSGMPYRQVDWARRVRNEIAHPDGRQINATELAQAVDTLEEVARRLGTEASTEDEPAETGNPAPAAGSGRPVQTRRAVGTPSATVLLLVAGAGCTVSIVGALAGIPTVMLALAALSKVNTDRPAAERLTRIGWATLGVLLGVTGFIALTILFSTVLAPR